MWTDVLAESICLLVGWKVKQKSKRPAPTTTELGGVYTVARVAFNDSRDAGFTGRPTSRIGGRGSSRFSTVLSGRALVGGYGRHMANEPDRDTPPADETPDQKRLREREEADERRRAANEEAEQQRLLDREEAEQRRRRNRDAAQRSDKSSEE